jgi:hypothetical protein
VRESGGDSSRIYGTTGAVESESERKHGHCCLGWCCGATLK